MNWCELVWLPILGTVYEVRPKNQYELACNITIKRTHRKEQVHRQYELVQTDFQNLLG